MEMLGIRDVARESGISAHTLRYYERIGLISDVARDDAGRRMYSEQDFGWIAEAPPPLLRFNRARFKGSVLSFFCCKKTKKTSHLHGTEKWLSSIPVELSFSFFRFPQFHSIPLN